MKQDPYHPAASSDIPLEIYRGWRCWQWHGAVHQEDPGRSIVFQEYIPFLPLRCFTPLRVKCIHGPSKYIHSSIKKTWSSSLMKYHISGIIKTPVALVTHRPIFLRVHERYHLPMLPSGNSRRRRRTVYLLISDTARSCDCTCRERFYQSFPTLWTLHCYLVDIM